jgi:hypothetical protein
VTLDLKTTQTANAEKAIGWLAFSNTLVNFEVDGRLPSSKNYTPILDTKQVVHKMSDGGIRVQSLAEKRSAKIKYKYATESFRNTLRTTYDLQTNMIFDAFGTMTGWADEFVFECVWPGKFDLAL